MQRDCSKYADRFKGAVRLGRYPISQPMSREISSRLVYCMNQLVSYIKILI